MSILDRYDDFSELTIGPDSPPGPGQEALENARLEAFESGYQAGWDDASSAHAADKERIAADLAQNLQDMSFTYHEAFAKLTQAMRPLLSKITLSLLPQTLQKSLNAQVMQALDSLIEKQGENAIALTVAPENLNQLQDLLGQELQIPFSLVADPSLVGGQVFLRVNTQERQIDLSAVLARLTEALDAFHLGPDQETDDG